MANVQILVLLTTLCWISGFSTTVALRLNNTLLNDTYACGNNTEVIFTCEVTGAAVLVWSSDELIGTGGTELPFAAGVNMVGDRRPSGINDHTFAILTVNDVVEGQTRLVSELHVNATVEVPTATVSCHNQQADDDPVTALYVVIDFPGVPRDILGAHLRHFNDTNDTCLISSFWRGPDNAPHAGDMNYMVNMAGNLSVVEVLNIPGIEGPRLAYFSLSNCSSVNISVGATNVCGIGPMSTNLTLDPIPCEDSRTCSFIRRLVFNSAPLMRSLNIIVVALTAYFTFLML